MALIVTANCPSPVNVNDPYTGQINVSGDTPPDTFVSSGGPFPPGLVLNAATGAITGTPTLPGNYNCAVTVTDSLANTGFVVFNIIVSPDPGNSRLSTWIKSSVDTDCLPEGKRIITQSWDIGSLPFTVNTSVIPNNQDPCSGVFFTWNLLTAQGNVRLSRYESLIISIDRFATPALNMNSLFRFDNGNGLPIFIGAKAAGPWMYAIVPYNSNSDTMTIGIEIDQNALPPAKPVGTLTLGVANYKIPPVSWLTASNFFDF